MSNNNEDANELRRLTVALPELLLKVLRVKCAEEGVSISEYVRRLLAQDLRMRYTVAVEERDAPGRPRGNVEIE